MGRALDELRRHMEEVTGPHPNNALLGRALLELEERIDDVSYRVTFGEEREY